MKILGNPDWTHPAIKLKNRLIGPVKDGLAATGRWVPRTEAERATEQGDTLSVAGDRPSQRRLSYARTRPDREVVDGLLYTPEGMGIVNGKIVARYSVRPPSVAEVLRTPTSAVTSLRRATVLEGETPYTYGDWVCEFLHSLVTAEDVAEPVLLPKGLASKPYVSRDLDRLGLSWKPVAESVLIEEATVLPKRLPSYYWRPDDVAAYRRAFGYEPRPARAGSLLYLGRFGTVSESVQRDYPTEAVAAIVESLGGRVFDTRRASPEAFEELAGDAETVIADQGSALFGVMQWQTRSVIELTTRDWWHNANLFIADGAGVENYAVIETGGLGEAALRERIVKHLAAFA